MSDHPTESVWDYPRPPSAERTSRRVRAVLAGHVIADTTRAMRVCETSHPPVYYVPPNDVAMEHLESSALTSHCEFKGQAHYYSLVADGVRRSNAAWYYPHPSPGYEELANHIAFYAWGLDEATVDGEQVTPQPGHFYGGWITSEISGPFKGEPGTLGW